MNNDTLFVVHDLCEMKVLRHALYASVLPFLVDGDKRNESPQMKRTPQNELTKSPVCYGRGHRENECVRNL